MADSLAAGNLTLNPLYKEVLARITRSLAEGEWKPGEALPSEPKLAERYDVSIGTLRKAIDELVAARVLLRQQGRGTFVTTHNQSRALYYFFHIVDRDGVKRYPRSRLAAFQQGRASAEIAEHLGIDTGAEVFKITNVLSLDDAAVIVDDIVIPRALFRGLNRAMFENRESTIYGLYQSRFQINVVHAVERLRARAATSRVADLLAIPVGSPVLEIQRVAYTYDDRPVEVRTSRVNTSNHDYLHDLI